jgi:hypothetical protein
MREPKRLAHRQAERNKAKALKQWTREDGDEETPASTPAATSGGAESRREPSNAQESLHRDR